MADNPPERKKNFDDWRNIAFAGAKAREAAQRRKTLLAALGKFIHANGGWVTSVPGAKYVRADIRKDSALPVKLVDLGYDLRHCGVSTQIANGNFLPVDIIEITLK